MKTKKLTIYKHPDEMYILPVFRFVYEKVGKSRYITLDFSIWNITGYIIFKIK